MICFGTFIIDLVMLRNIYVLEVLFTVVILYYYVTDQHITTELLSQFCWIAHLHINTSAYTYTSISNDDLYAFP